MLARKIIASLMLASFAVAAAAQESDSPPDGGPPEDDKPYSWGLGIGGISKQQAYTGIDRDNMGIPLIYFENRWVQLFGPWLDIKLPSLEFKNDQELSFGIRTQFFGTDGYEADDAPILAGMEERKESLLVGAYAKWSNPFADFSAEYLQDVSGESEGSRIKVGVEKSWQVGQHWRFTPSATATYYDDKYIDYYYGVRANEARVGRPVYVGDATMNFDVGLRTDYMFDQHQAVFVMLEYTALGSEIDDSPLTDRSNETMVLLGYLYRF